MAEGHECITSVGNVLLGKKGRLSHPLIRAVGASPQSQIWPHFPQRVTNTIFYLPAK